MEQFPLLYVYKSEYKERPTIHFTDLLLSVISSLKIINHIITSKHQNQNHTICNVLHNIFYTLNNEICSDSIYVPHLKVNAYSFKHLYMCI